MEDITMTASFVDIEPKQKIRTPFAKMIVGGSLDKPCYSIMYLDPTDKMYHIGFSSFHLPYVFQWFQEEFEIIEDDEIYAENKVCSVCGNNLCEETDHVLKNM